jgi:hypothetical protein
MDRRSFLVHSGALVGGALLTPWSAVIDASSAAAAGTAGKLTVFGPLHPRAFAFRQAEVLVNTRRYAQWEATFRPLGGIVGKLLQEEQSDVVTDRNLAYFAKFKGRYPQKLALLHLNGQGRLPEFETGGWYAGWWLYRAGATIVDNATPEATTLRVATTSPFSLTVDRLGGKWEDVVITAVHADGRPDFDRAEQGRLVGIDAAAKTLEVERGCYGSSALDWSAGSYVAQHLTSGPWYQGGDKLWHYNFAPVAPRDPQGRHVIDAIAAGLAPRFAPGGALAFLDGIELDVFSLAPAQRSNVDTDADGVADSGYVGGVDVYTAGLSDLTARLRADVLGPDRLLLADGGANQQPDVAHVNGIEIEGVPRLTDDEMLRWSQATEILAFYGRAARAPAFSYGMYKLLPALQPPDRFARFRLVLAASLLSGAAFTYFDDPLPGTREGVDRFTIWDELPGEVGAVGWLGRALAGPVHVNAVKPDLYNGAGTKVPASFVAGVIGEGTQRSDRARPRATASESPGPARTSTSRSLPSRSRDRTSCLGSTCPPTLI